MLGHMSSDVTTAFPRQSAKRGELPDGGLGGLLAAMTPEGAAALQCQPWGMWTSFVVYPLPLTTAEPRRNWIRERLEAVQFTDRRSRQPAPLRPVTIDQLVAMLAPGTPRPDGLPAWRPQAEAHRFTADGHLGAWLRRVAAAVASDLGDHDLTEVSARLLGLHDHEIPNVGMPGSTPGYPGRAGECRRHGRELLAILGCWPWVHAERGRLPGSWRDDPAFIEPLLAWHDRALVELERELARSRDALDALIPPAG